MSIQEPSLPKTQQITYTIQSGDQLQVIASQHHTTVDAILKLNGIKNADKINAGATLKIDAVSEKEYKKYQDLKAKYDDQVYQQQKAEEIKQRTANAEAKIAQAKKNGWEDDYSFGIDKEGFMHVKLKCDKKLADIRDDFHLPWGSLNDTNNFEARYGQIPTVNIDREVQTWDNYEAKKGESFRLDTDKVATRKTFTQFFRDLLPF